MLKQVLNSSDFLDKAEKLFTVASLLLFMNSVIPLIIIQGASEGDGIDISSFNFAPLNLLFITSYIITTSLLILRWNKVLYFASKNYLLIILSLMIPLSYLWSAVPNETSRASVGMIGTILFGIYLASRFSLKEQVNLFGWTFGIAIILSMIFIIALPKYGVMGGTHSGAWRGIWTHKNALGGSMVLSSCIFLLLSMSVKSRRKIFPVAGVAASYFLAIGSNSTAAILNLAISFIFIMTLVQASRLRSYRFIFFTFSVAAFMWGLSVLFTDFANVILGFFGKDLTITGRTDIWMAVMNKIQERPWLGYGFNGFWHGIDGESAEIIRAVRWGVPNSHSGFLDFVLQLGLVGFSIFLLIYFIALVKSLFLIPFYPGSSEYLWPPIILIYYIVAANATESALLAQNNFSWILFTTVAMTVAFEFQQIRKV